MNLQEIRTPEDILEFMKTNIKYGWLDINNKEHIGNMKEFRRLYRTSNIEETLEHGIGTCIEQVNLMHILLDRLNIKNKMFCTRIYEGEDFSDLEAEEHMHCFVLYYLNDKVYQIEHPNWERIGIYEYEDEETAINKINEYYINMSGGCARPVTEFYEVEPNLSFKQFNSYINNIDNSIREIKEKLVKVDEMIDLSNNISSEIKTIVKAICKGYIRESKGKISLDGIKNVCNTTFVSIHPNDIRFLGENKILGQTDTSYDEECNINHIMSYVNDSNYIKLISILTHELGHVITEFEPCSIKNGVYNWVKRTAAFYQNCSYDESGTLLATEYFGFRIADGFLESISSKIFESDEFRLELLNAGYDLKDYKYKDERIFPSRIYDEYKACFELFDYIMDGALFDFSCRKYSNNEELVSDINKNKLNLVFKYLDESNDALWQLKRYEGKASDEEFELLLDNYKKKKDISINLSIVLLDMYGKTNDDVKYQELLNIYKNIIEKQHLLPLETSGFQSSANEKKI